MKIIPLKIIRDWYKEEYSTKHNSSVYGKPVKALVTFFNLLDKDQKKREVLELGCGDGRNIIELAKRGHTVTGIDLFGKESTEARARKLNLKITFFRKDISTFSFQRRKYDVVICSEVFHLLNRRTVRKVIKKMKRSTTDKGYIYISILSNLKRFSLKSKEEFKYKGQSDYSYKEAKGLMLSEFKSWRIIKLGRFHDEQNWPLRKGTYPLEPYHWGGDYIYIIAQRK